ncbi:hypothetical protein IQ17_02013 [Bradyrhizobium daqingense]|uniref:Uncharacterized protein n=2 Tax=Bradyrhizobium TaxID=374 RepID=A0A562S4L5_9BRAD|nr:hypothetical protein IQ17_02013 [Bradyrhizobium daqingense]TWI76202.1 hypothetical protein IQ16_00437 [Bradyrhizobium huanghuaihaiense]GLR93226.1 hypothetical protein GCM10007858_08500 [Bradyrhizobium liaoningense]
MPALLHCGLPLQFVEGSPHQHASVCIEVVWIDEDLRQGGMIIQQSANFRRRGLWIKRESLWLYGEGRLSGVVA